MDSETIGPDHPDFDDNPEWTDADFARAKPASEVLPPELYRALVRGRGPAKRPTKKAVSIRLSPRVLNYYRGQGTGWQTRLNADLESLISSGGQAKQR